MYVAGGMTDKAELTRLAEAGYNNRKLVPEHPRIIAGWERDAAAYREAADAEYDLPYLDEAGGGTARTRLDIFWPHGSDRETCHIAMFVHGGYWQGLDRKFFSHLARGPNRHGIALALPSYDLCPDVDIATIERQIASVCLFLWNTYGRRVVISGHSAGGHLTAAMLVQDFGQFDRAAPFDLVPAGLSISGIFDLRDLVFTSLNDKVGMTDETARAASPLFKPAPAGKTLLSFVGEKESAAFHWQSQEIARVWGSGGAAVEHLVVPGADHFTIVAQLTDPNSIMSKSLATLALTTA